MSTLLKLFSLVPPQASGSPEGLLKFVDFKDYAFKNSEYQPSFEVQTKKAYFLLFALLFGDNYTELRFAKFCKLLQAVRDEPLENTLKSPEIQTTLSPRQLDRAWLNGPNRAWFSLQRQFLIEARIMRVAHSFLTAESGSELHLKEVVVLMPAVELYLAMHQRISDINNFKQHQSSLLFEKDKSKCTALKIICDFIIHAYTGNGEPIFQGAMHASSLMLPPFMKNFRHKLQSQEFAVLASMYYQNTSFALRMAFRLESCFNDEISFPSRNLLDSTFTEITNKCWLTMMQSDALEAVVATTLDFSDVALDPIKREIYDEKVSQLEASRKALQTIFARTSVFYDFQRNNEVDKFDINVTAQVAEPSNFLKVTFRGLSETSYTLKYMWYSSSKKTLQFLTFSTTADNYKSICFAYQTQCLFFCDEQVDVPLDIINRSEICCCLDEDIAKYVFNMSATPLGRDNDFFLTDGNYATVENMQLHNLPWFVQLGGLLTVGDAKAPLTLGLFNQITNAIDQDLLFHSNM